MAITRREYLSWSAASVAAVVLGASSGVALTGCSSGGSSSSSSGTADSNSGDSAQSFTMPTESTVGQAAGDLFPDMKGTPTDYSNKDNWMYRPETHEYDADVLYFYPTVYSDVYADLYADIDAESMRQSAQAVYKAQGSAFEGLADVYVPYYRQFNGAYLGFYDGDAVFDACHDLPRTDLYAALDYYFENINDGSPFILAGHSQGSIMLNIIMREYFRAHADYLDHLVATYQIGYSLTTDMLADNPALKAATCADDTGVIVSWNTEGPGNADAGITYVKRENALSINPLNWSTDDTYAGVELNLGSVYPDASGNYALQAGIADAQVNLDRGTVVTTTVDAVTFANKGVTARLFGPESYHSNDYGFYYANIRENASVRIASWLAKG